MTSKQLCEWVNKVAKGDKETALIQTKQILKENKIALRDVHHLELVGDNLRIFLKLN